MTDIVNEILPVQKAITTDRMDLLVNIKKKRAKLEEVRSALKAKFDGIDKQIDKIVESIESWFTCPIAMFRPTIVNLWGLTGTGKTDLVRTLVKLLDFQERFLEIQMANKWSYYSSSSIADVLAESNLETKTPGILLLDEMQRFCSKGEDGSKKEDYLYQDVWMLLSDGRFTINTQNLQDIKDMVYSQRYRLEQDRHRKKWEEHNKTKKKRKFSKDSEEKQEVDAPWNIRADDEQYDFHYRCDVFDAKRFKTSLRLNESVENIMTWSQNKKEGIVEGRLNDPSAYEGEDYTKLLIFISGNLDEAYRNASDVSNACNDADRMHVFCNTYVNVLRVKECLGKRFTPEQIARFGNCHIIYPSFGKKTYYDIIRRYTKLFVQKIEESHQVSIELDDSIYDLIYRNGVYPSQGVRPVMTTISTELSSVLPLLLMKSIENDASTIYLSVEDNYFVGVTGGESCRKEAWAEIDSIRDNHVKNIDTISCTCVHEAGHTLVYCILHGRTPLNVRIDLDREQIQGITETLGAGNTQKGVWENAVVGYGGIVAEKAVFGEDLVSEGAANDISYATEMLAYGIRSLGLHVKDTHHKTFTPADPDSVKYVSELAPTNNVLKNITKKAYDKATEIILANMEALKDITVILMRDSIVSDEQIKEICDRHGIKVELSPKNNIDCLEGKRGLRDYRYERLQTWINKQEMQSCT